MAIGILALGFFLLAIGPANAAVEAPPSPAHPQRVVSINLCVDILALTLADPGTVKSVYRLTAEEEDSPIAALARGIPTNDSLAEEVLAYRPDLVLASVFSSTFTIDLLRRAHVPVVVVKDALSFSDIRDNIRTVAAALGRVERGEAWIARFDAMVARTRREQAPDGPSAVIYEDLGNAATPGTLVGEVIAHTGFRNVVGKGLRPGYGNLSIEDLIRARPDLVGIGIYRPNAPSRASALLAHPALKDYMANHARTLRLPAMLWSCSTPYIGDIAERLAAAHDEMTAGARP